MNKKRIVPVSIIVLLAIAGYVGWRYAVEGDNFLSIFSGATGVLFVWYAVTTFLLVSLLLFGRFVLVGESAAQAWMEKTEKLAAYKRSFWRGLKRLLVLRALLLVTIYLLHGAVAHSAAGWHWDSWHLFNAAAGTCFYLLFRRLFLLNKSTKQKRLS